MTAFVKKDVANEFKQVFETANKYHFLHSIVPSEFKHTDMSLLLKLKVIKSENEIQSAKRIHTRDSAMLVEFFYLVVKFL